MPATRDRPGCERVAAGTIPRACGSGFSRDPFVAAAGRLTPGHGEPYSASGCLVAFVFLFVGMFKRPGSEESKFFVSEVVERRYVPSPGHLELGHDDDKISRIHARRYVCESNRPDTLLAEVGDEAVCGLLVRIFLENQPDFPVDPRCRGRGLPAPGSGRALGLGASHRGSRRRERSRGRRCPSGSS